MATADIGTPQWQISGTPEWQAQTDLVHVSGKLQVAPYDFFEWQRGQKGLNEHEIYIKLS